MPRYTVKMQVIMMGIEQIEIDDQAEYSIGQTISVSPKSPMTVSDGKGGRVSLTPGISMSGVIVSKR